MLKSGADRPPSGPPHRCGDDHSKPDQAERETVPAVRKLKVPSSQGPGQRADTPSQQRPGDDRAPAGIASLRCSRAPSRRCLPGFRRRARRAPRVPGQPVRRPCFRGPGLRSPCSQRPCGGPPCLVPHASQSAPFSPEYTPPPRASSGTGVTLAQGYHRVPYLLSMLARNRVAAATTRRSPPGTRGRPSPWRPRSGGDSCQTAPRQPTPPANLSRRAAP